MNSFGLMEKKTLILAGKDEDEFDQWVLGLKAAVYMQKKLNINKRSLMCHMRRYETHVLAKNDPDVCPLNLPPTSHENILVKSRLENQKPQKTAQIKETWIEMNARLVKYLDIVLSKNLIPSETDTAIDRKRLQLHRDGFFNIEEDFLSPKSNKEREENDGMVRIGTDNNMIQVSTSSINCQNELLATDRLQEAMKLKSLLEGCTFRLKKLSELIETVLVQQDETSPSRIDKLTRGKQ